MLIQIARITLCIFCLDINIFLRLIFIWIFMFCMNWTKNETFLCIILKILLRIENDNRKSFILICRVVYLININLGKILMPKQKMYCVILAIWISILRMSNLETIIFLIESVKISKMIDLNFLLVHFYFGIWGNIFWIQG